MSLIDRVVKFRVKEFYNPKTDYCFDRFVVRQMIREQCLVLKKSIEATDTKEGLFIASKALATDKTIFLSLCLKLELLYRVHDNQYDDATKTEIISHVLGNKKPRDASRPLSVACAILNDFEALNEVKKPDFQLSYYLSYSPAVVCDRIKKRQPVPSKSRKRKMDAPAVQESDVQELDVQESTVKKTKRSVRVERSRKNEQGQIVVEIMEIHRDKDEKPLFFIHDIFMTWEEVEKNYGTEVLKQAMDVLLEELAAMDVAFDDFDLKLLYETKIKRQPPKFVRAARDYDRGLALMNGLDDIQMVEANDVQQMNDNIPMGLVEEV